MESPSCNGLMFSTGDKPAVLLCAVSAQKGMTLRGQGSYLHRVISCLPLSSLPGFEGPASYLASCFQDCVRLWRGLPVRSAASRARRWLQPAPVPLAKAPAVMRCCHDCYSLDAHMLCCQLLLCALYAMVCAPALTYSRTWRCAYIQSRPRFCSYWHVMPCMEASWASAARFPLTQVFG